MSSTKCLTSEAMISIGKSVESEVSRHLRTPLAMILLVFTSSASCLSIEFSRLTEQSLDELSPIVKEVVKYAQLDAE